MRTACYVFAFAVQAASCICCCASEPAEKAVSAFEKTDKFLAEFEAKGTWERTAPGGLEYSGTFVLRNHGERYYLKTECKRKTAEDDFEGDLSFIPDTVIIVDDGKTVAGNVFGNLAGPRPCLIRLRERSDTSRRSLSYHLQKDLSRFCRVLNPMTVREDMETLKKKGDGYRTKSSLNEKYWKTARVSEDSGYNVGSWSLEEKDGGEPVGGATTHWEKRGGGWVPAAYEHWTVVNLEGGIATASIVFESFDVGREERKDDYTLGALEPCKNALITDLRSQTQYRVRGPKTEAALDMPVTKALGMLPWQSRDVQKALK